jgi:hypothetical protein
MTDARYDRAPGDISISAEAERRTLSDVSIYTIGLALAVILTATSSVPFLDPPATALGFPMLGQPGTHLLDGLGYFRYHHDTRTHLSLNKDCPRPRPVQPPSAGNIIAFPEVGGLHHRYERRAA